VSVPEEFFLHPDGSTEIERQDAEGSQDFGLAEPIGGVVEHELIPFPWEATRRVALEPLGFVLPPISGPTQVVVRRVGEGETKTEAYLEIIANLLPEAVRDSFLSGAGSIDLPIPDNDDNTDDLYD
jgi:hypothetical protein